MSRSYVGLDVALSQCHIYISECDDNEDDYDQDHHSVNLQNEYEYIFVSQYDDDAHYDDAHYDDDIDEAEDKENDDDLLSSTYSVSVSSKSGRPPLRSPFKRCRASSSDLSFLTLSSFLKLTL